MRLAIFGLTVSSSWGNGHATLWRGLLGALVAQGHRVTFFERDVPYYAQHRDMTSLPDGGELVLYNEWDDVAAYARRVLARSDVGLVTSYCPDGVAATALVATSRVVRCFYDLDTPVTLARLATSEPIEYLGPDGLAPFDIVLSYTGGPAIDALRDQLGARRVTPFHGWVDPALYGPAAPRADVSGVLTYLGTYAADRQPVLQRLFVDDARERATERFVIGGAQYPADFPWSSNIWFVRHVPPPDHPSFYASGRFTLNVTRAAMASMGWCPSGRLFEAAACGTPIITDCWPGLETFFTPGDDILTAFTASDVLAALDTPEATRLAIARRARERTLDQHSAARRATQLVAALEFAEAA